MRKRFRQRINVIVDGRPIITMIKEEEDFNRQLLIAALTGTTAVIHIYLGGTLFVLKGLGFLAALGAHYAVPQRESYQRWTREGLFGYTQVSEWPYKPLSPNYKRRRVRFLRRR